MRRARPIAPAHGRHHRTPPALNTPCPSCDGVLRTVAGRAPRTTHHGAPDCPRQAEETP